MVALPCVEFVGEDLVVGDAAIQTLRREHAEFGFGLSTRAAAGAAFSGLVGPVAVVTRKPSPTGARAKGHLAFLWIVHKPPHLSDFVDLVTARSLDLHCGPIPFANQRARDR